MSAALFTPKRMRITTERYQKMVAAGVLTPSDRVELIEGEILDMTPIGTKHAGIAGRLVKRFMLALGDRAIVRAASPIDLGEFSEPEPDMLLLRPRDDDYMHAHPTAQDAFLLIEVADSSLAFDQGAKRDLYARFGVVEYWVVNVNESCIVVYRDPALGVFRQVSEYRNDDRVSPQAFPDVRFAISRLFA